MEVKDYVKIFRLDQENYNFNRGEFLDKMGEDLLELCKNTALHPEKVNPLTGHLYYSEFRNIVRYFENKYNEINQLSVNKLSVNLWKAFFAVKVVPLRKSWYPEVQDHIEHIKKKEKEFHSTQDKKSLTHKNKPNVKKNR